MLPARSRLWSLCGRSISNPRSFSAATAKPVRVRFAPSPTGTLHVGGARTALFNWLSARQSENGTFIVRVEDTDEARSTRESEQSILSDLKWLGLQWDEGPDVGGAVGPYRQSERKAIYAKYAEQLLSEGKAYHCFCSDEEIAQMKEDAIKEGRVNRYNGKWRNASAAEVQRKLVQGEPYTVRFRVPPNCRVSVEDQVRGVMTWDADAALGDFILLRSNGMPVYNFCVAVDDLTMGITHVIRAEEHLPNTLRQVLLFNALDQPHPVYAHCSLILAADRSKLSKRHGATSITQFREAGYLPGGMVNYLCNIGWNDGTTKEIYTIDELVNVFSMNNIVKSAAVFDIEKLNWVNSHHVKMLLPDRLRELLGDALCGHGLLDPSVTDADARRRFLQLVTSIGQPLICVTNDIRCIVSDILDYPFMETMQLTDLSIDSEELAALSHSERKSSVQADAAVVQSIVQDDFESLAKIILREIENNGIPDAAADCSEASWKAFTKRLSTESGRKGKRLFHPLRLLLTGRISGPDVGMQLQLLRAANGLIDTQVVPLVTLRQRGEILKAFLEARK